MRRMKRTPLTLTLSPQAGRGQGEAYSAVSVPHVAIAASYGFPTLHFGWSHALRTIGHE